LIDIATLPRRRRRKCAASMTRKSSATYLGEDWASGFPTMSSHPDHPRLPSASVAMNRSTRTASSLFWSTSRSSRTRMLSSKLLTCRNL
ncbi:ISA3, partial [Symbiodinium sp. KB8]